MPPHVKKKMSLSFVSGVGIHAVAVDVFLSNEDFMLCQNPREKGEPAEVATYAENPKAPSAAPMSRSATFRTNF